MTTKWDANSFNQKIKKYIYCIAFGILMLF